MLIIPLSAIPAQRFNVQLGSQDCQITVRQRTTGVFLDLVVSGRPILSGMLGLHGVRLIRDAYLGFVGDLMFLDTQGSDDPQQAGFGTRWVLAYLAPADLGANA